VLIVLVLTNFTFIAAATGGIMIICADAEEEKDEFLIMMVMCRNRLNMFSMCRR